MARTQPGVLSFRQPDGSDVHAPLKAPLTTIGRSDACDVVVKHANVSRLHAQIALEHDRYILSDAASRNGTLVNGTPLTEPRLLSSGDEIWLASSAVALHFADPEETMLLPTGTAPPEIAIDVAARAVAVHGVDTPLSPLEYGLLYVLAEHAGAVCRREDCFAAVWGQPYDHGTCEDALNTCLAKLRRHLRAAAARTDHAPPRITTLARIGFRLDAAVAIAPAGRPPQIDVVPADEPAA